jgi:D-hexose-6-phosphate mutarotase
MARMPRSHPLIRTSLPDWVLLVEGASTLPRLDISTPTAIAQAYLHGAHLTGWQPATTSEPVIWLSANSLFRPDKPIRGGVPICLPWFGPHASDKAAPAHGFARLVDWALTAAEESADGVTLAFSLRSDGVSPPVWTHPFLATCRLRIGSRLTMELDVQNSGSEPFTFEEALHTYFAVQNVERVTIGGLHKLEYLDKVADFDRMTQDDERIRFTGETDRVYVDTTATCVIHDPGLKRRIVVGKSGSRSTIVWNPWIDKARAMADFGDAEWRSMVCVETGNVGSDAIRLTPDQSHTMRVEISVETD